MAIQGFDKEFYLNAKLAQLQNDPQTAADWAGKDAAFLEARLENGFGLTAEQHYEQYGYQEDLAPNAFFNPAEYIRAKATDMFNDPASTYLTIDAAADAFVSLWGGNVYNHYLQYGEEEGINPSNNFDVSAYLEAKLADLQAKEATAAEWAGKSVADVAAAFKASGLTALEHFTKFGQDEGLSAPAVPADEQVVVEEGENPNQGDTLSLTTGADNLVGTNLNDTFNAAPINQLGQDANTLQQFDVIDGGAGTDTLNIYAKSTAAPNATAFNTNQVGTVRNVEIINIFNNEADDALFGGDAVRADLFEGSEQVWQIGDATDVARLNDGQTAGFRNIEVGAAAAARSIELGMAAGQNVSNIFLDNVTAESTASTNTQTGVLGFTVDGANEINIDGAFTFEGVTNCGDPATRDGQMTLTALSVAGSVLTLNSAVNVALATDFDYSFTELAAAESTGGIELTTASNGSDLHTVTTGSGADDVTVNTDATAAQAVTVSTGEGNDEITVNNDGAGVTNIDAGAGDNEITVTDTSRTLNIVTGDGDNKLTFGTDFQVEGDGTALANLNVTLGAGDDEVVFENLLMSQLGATWVIDGGEGTNSVTLGVGTGRTFTPTDYTALTERLVNFSELTLESDENYTVDASKMTGYDTFGFDGTGTYNIINVADQTLTVNNGTLVAVSEGFAATNAGTALTQTNVVDGDVYDAVTSYGGTVNVTASGGTYDLEAIGDDSATVVAYADTLALNVLANSDVALGENADIRTLDVTLNTSRTFDNKDCPDEELAGVTGSALTVDAGNHAELTTITLSGEGAAVITGGNKLATIDASDLSPVAFDDETNAEVAGQGLNFTTDNAAVAETITLSAGIDVVTFQADTGTWGSTVANTDEIIGLNLVEDEEAQGTIDDVLSDQLVLEGGVDLISSTTLSAEQQTDLASLSFNNKLDFLAQLDTDNDAYYVFDHEGDTYIFGDQAGEGRTNGVTDATDLLIKVAGVQDHDLLIDSVGTPA